jgi:hypothetical protein
MVRTPRWLPLLCIAAFAVALTVPADPALAKTVRIPKKGANCADDPACHNRWHPDIKPAATADPGDTVVFGTRDAFDHASLGALRPPTSRAPTSTWCIR